MTKNWEKNTAEKKIKFFLNQKLQFTYPLASIKKVQVTEEAFSSKNMKFYNFFLLCGSFLLSWIRIRIPDPDQLTRLNPDPIGIRIRNPGMSRDLRS